MTPTLSNLQSLSLKSVQSDLKFNYYLNKKPDNQYWKLRENNEEIIMSVYNDYWHQHWGNLCMTIIFNGLYPQIHCTYLPFHFIHTIWSPPNPPQHPFILILIQGYPGQNMDDIVIQQYRPFFNLYLIYLCIFKNIICTSTSIFVIVIRQNPI